MIFDLPHHSNTYITHDAFNNPIRLEWERIEGKSPRLNEALKSVRDLLIQTYTQQELSFARKHPEAIPTEHFLKSLTPYFEQIEKADWSRIEQEIHGIFTNFFTNTDFAQFSEPGSVQCLVTAYDEKSGKLLGFIQFLTTSAFGEDGIKAGMFAVVSDAKDRGLDKILMSSIFKLMPTIQRIFAHTRATNKYELGLYSSWGFVHIQDGYWVNSEYSIASSDILQKTAETLVEKL